MARTVTTAEIKPPIRQGETAVVDFTNPDGSDPAAWTLGVYLSYAVTGEPIALGDTTVEALDDADHTIRVTFGASDTESLATGEIYGELWRENGGNETLLRAFRFTVADPIRVPAAVPAAALTVGDDLLTIGGEILTIGA